MTATAVPPGPVDAIALHERRVQGLARTLGASGVPVQRIDTHLSSVLVTPHDAYKLKKPVALGFVDFTDAAVRRAVCADELRLNRRLAPALYLGVVPIEGPPDAPTIGAPLPEAGAAQPGEAASGEPASEHAVWMRTFPQSALWERRVPAGQVDAAQAAAFGRAIGVFHRDRARRCPGSPHGTAQAVQARVRENFAALRGSAAVAGAESGRSFALTEAAAEARGARLAATIDARNRDGFVRDAHGDLHLGNVVTIDGEAIAFDCLEFDVSLRTVDVANEVAFAMMDLQHAGRPDLAFAFLDGWLEATGDFAAVPLLDHYRAYRAMVRAKVAAIRASQSGAPASDPACAGYLALAGAFDRRAAPVLVAMHGLSGSGKSVLSATLAAAIGAVRLRSDVERKRALGLAPADRRGAHGAIYATAARDAVYDALAGLARPLLEAGWPVVVDASFLSRAQRDRFRTLATQAGAGFAIADLQAPEAVLRARLAARAAAGGDPSDADGAVLDAQLRAREPLDDAERALAFVHRADDPTGPDAVAAAWHRFAADAPRAPRPAA